MNWWSEYIGIEFGKVNCWSLLTMIYKDRLGIELPSYDINPSDIRSVHKAMVEGQNPELWTEVLDPIELDAVGMKNPGTNRIGHVGIMIDPKRVLHIEEMSHSVIVPIDHFSIKHRIVGFRRLTCLF